MRRMVLFGFGALDKQSVEKTVNFFLRAEKAGFDYGWLPDFCEMASLYPVLTLIAQKTHRMKLGSAVTNPFTRHPLVTASTIATLDQISKGRAVLGISSGDGAALKSIGIEFKKPVLAVKESIERIREQLRNVE